MFDTFTLVVIALALVFDFINGFHDTANAIATSVSTRALKPRTALMLAAMLNFLGAMYSTGVAKTIGSEIVKSPQMVNSHVLVAAMLAAIIWNLVTWWLSLPSSSSHALVGGLLGSVLIARGPDALTFHGIGKIIASLILSPIGALLIGMIIMLGLVWTLRRLPRIELTQLFRRLQVMTAAMMSFSHGSNDAQKSMGIMTLTLVSAGYLTEMEVPLWVKIAAALSMALGTAIGGRRIIRTVGTKISKLEPLNGFAADLNSSIVIFTATLMHLPVSTTHVVSGSIMGVSAAKRMRSVHWSVAQQMVAAWIMTIPITALLSAILYLLSTSLF